MVETKGTLVVARQNMVSIAGFVTLLVLGSVPSVFADSQIMMSTPSTGVTPVGAAPKSQTFAGDSPEGQAIHRRLMQAQMNQQQFQRQEAVTNALSDRASLQAELTDVDERLSRVNSLSEKDRKSLDDRRAQLADQIKVTEQKLK